MPQGACRRISEIARAFVAAPTAWQMADEYIERVARLQHSGSVQDVARWAAVAGIKRNAQAFGMEKAEAERLIEQCHVNAARVFTLRHEIGVVQSAQDCSAAQVVDHCVVFNFTQCHEINGDGTTCSGNGASQFLLFAPIARTIPAAIGTGEKFLIVEASIVEGVEEVFHVVGHDAERLCFSAFRRWAG